MGTEHLVVAVLWLDAAHELRRLGISYQQATEQLATLPRSEQVVEDTGIEPLEAMAVRHPPRWRLPSSPASRPSSTPSTGG